MHPEQAAIPPKSHKLNLQEVKELNVNASSIDAFKTQFY